MAADRDRLVEKHLDLVHAIAGKLKRTLGRAIEFDDLVAYGSKGLVEAADRFDAAHGAAFTTFAYYRISGAMLDGMRTMGWYSRADYARYRAEERANEYLQSVSEREGAARSAAPSGTESGAADPLEGIAEILGGVATIHITALEAAATIADDSLPAPDESLATRELGARVREAVAKLPEKERRLIELYYFGDKNLEEAGAALGLSKSWACRLHARAVSMIKDALAGS